MTLGPKIPQIPSGWESLESCRVCDQDVPAEDVAIVLCDRCRQRFESRMKLAEDGRMVEIMDEAGVAVACFPTEYSDAQLGRIGEAEWFERASLRALRATWDMTQESREYLFMIQCRIAHTVKQRLGFNGAGWAAEGAKVLQRSENLIRNYANIWQRLGSFIEDDPRLITLGYSLLLRAAMAPDPEKEVLRFAEARDSGTTRKQLLSEANPTDCDHEFVQRCRLCGLVEGEVV